VTDAAGAPVTKLKASVFKVFRVGNAAEAGIYRLHSADLSEFGEPGTLGFYTMIVGARIDERNAPMLAISVRRVRPLPNGATAVDQGHVTTLIGSQP